MSDLEVLEGRGRPLVVVLDEAEEERRDDKVVLNEREVDEERGLEDWRLARGWL